MALAPNNVPDYPGGVAVVDCTGWDISDTSPQTIPGIYAAFKAAFDSGKMVMQNRPNRAVTGYTDHLYTTPTAVAVAYDAENDYIIVGGNRRITSSDVITVLS